MISPYITGYIIIHSDMTLLTLFMTWKLMTVITC